MNIVLKDCGSFLTGRVDEIVDQWFDACRHDEALGVLVGKLSQKAFLDDIPEAIRGLAQTLQQGEGAYFKPSDGVLDAHSQHRWKQGFSLRQLIRDWGNLNKILVAEVDEFFKCHHQADTTARALVFARLSDFVKEALSESVRGFEALRQREAGGVARELEAIQAEFDQTTQSRSQLLREATHDLRGGLSAIAGATAVLKFAEQPNQVFAEALESLDRGVQSVKAMLDSLLDLSRLESGMDKLRLERVDIVPILTNIASEYRIIATTKQLQLDSDGDSALLVETDAEKVRRIVQNILINAIEYTDEGRVSLAWHCEPEQERWLISITDTGPGINNTCPTTLAHELEADSPLDKPVGEFSGEGIGLTIVKRLCETLGASMAVESSAENGTRFLLHFPLNYGTAEDTERESGPNAP